MIKLVDAFKIAKGKKAQESNTVTKLRYIQIGDLRNDHELKYAIGDDTNVLCNKKDILIAWDGANAGTVGYNLEGVIGSTLAKLTPRTDKINSSFAGRFLQSKSKFLRENCTGATIPHISRQFLENIIIPLPPIAEQQKIAAILDAADELRLKDRAVIEKYNELGHALFLDMFGDPVANTKDWEVKKLKDIATKIHSGNTPKGGSNVYVKKGIIFFRSQNVWRNKLEMDDVAHIDAATHRRMTKSSLKKGDILMTKTGRFNTENSSLGRAAIFLGEDDSANINGHVYLIRLQKSIVNEFVLFILTTDEFREHIRRVCVGGIDKRQLNKEHLEDFPIIYPPIELQRKFVQRLKVIEKQRDLATTSSLRSEELFNGLLQKAFKN